MLIDCITRFIRRKLVLGIIFGLSLSYCIFSFTKDYFDTLTKIEEPKLHVFRSQEQLKVFMWNSDHDTKNKTINATCRNSIQGKHLMADDKGYICKRSEMMTEGCCNTTSEFTKRYDCNTCHIDGCCSVYENCISCCLDPNKKSLLEDVFNKANGGLRIIFSSINDHFELCLTKCRTNSLSVQHENSYRNPLRKFCYGS